jgi:HD-like signal output (HDOD) protein
MSFFEIEQAVFGFDHAEIMSRACRLWRFPDLQATAIRYHHQPSCEEDQELACMIHLADIVVKSMGYDAGKPAGLDQIAPEIMEFLHIQLPDLNNVAAAVKNDLQKIKEELKEA